MINNYFNHACFILESGCTMSNLAPMYRRDMNIVGLNGEGILWVATIGVSVDKNRMNRLSVSISAHLKFRLILFAILTDVL